MIEDGLLSLGNIDAAREFVDWYAPHQFSNGKVPCCVDHRGADPVPENDSHGELIHAIAQLYRYGGDRAEVEKNWPHIDAAVAYMDELRASETGAANPAFKGMMPASISHEGYSSKPMHSYWDDLWALVGYNDAVDMAAALGRSEDAARIAKSRDEFRADLLASIASTVKAHAIDYMPGCAELGDFDATSATIAIAQAGELERCPSSSTPRSNAIGKNSSRAPTARARGKTTRRTNGARSALSCVWAGATARTRRSISSSAAVRVRGHGTSGPKWSATMRAKSVSSATCRTSGWRRISFARRSICSRMIARRITRSSSAPDCPRLDRFERRRRYRRIAHAVRLARLSRA